MFSARDAHPTRKYLESRAGLIAVASSALALAAWVLGSATGPVAPTEIAPGAIYCCRAVSDPDGSRGWMHLVTIALRGSGWEPYVTPLPATEPMGSGQYRLDWLPAVAQRERLLVGINATLFGSVWGRWSLPGMPAESVDTCIAEGKWGAYARDSYLLWFDDQGQAHWEPCGRVSDAARQRAICGIGGRKRPVVEGRLGHGLTSLPDSRTLVGTNREGSVLYLAVFERASLPAAAEALLQHGVWNAMTLDGGDSSGMTLGPAGTASLRGTKLLPHRPVATVFGIRPRGSEFPSQRSLRFADSAASTRQKMPLTAGNELDSTLR